jgi:cation diffusion facilitator CzcD-associated flavoprotein CzcO
MSDLPASAPVDPPGRDAHEVSPPRADHVVDNNDNDIGNVDVVVVGAGIAGLYMVYRLRSLGLSVRGFEAGSGVGGTWFWNRYPGCRCDVQSIDYSYSFSHDLEQEWDWSERFATQPEILAYLNHVADRFDLRRHFSFGTRVTAAVVDENALRWRVETDGGHSVSARYCVFATGSLSSASVPDIPGLSDFTGDWYHTGHWPHEGVDLRAQRIGVIGTGSSGIQVIPALADEVDHLFVFQRSPNFSIPAPNRPLTDEERAEVKATYGERRRLSRVSAAGSLHQSDPRSALVVPEEERQRAYEAAWERGGVLFSKTFNDQLSLLESNDTARAFVEEKIRSVVTDPGTADLLVPTDHPIGTKRICSDSGYYETFNRDNVTLVDIRADPITGIDPTGIATESRHYDLDVIVFATGFDAMTGALSRIDIRGRHGRLLRQAWAGGPETYLGLSVAGFPNLFIMTGPGSPSVLANMVLAAEQHADWIADCIGYLDAHGLGGIEATREAQSRWVATGNELASATLFPSASSWYLGANIVGKPRVFMPFIGGFGAYRTICDDVAEKTYDGFDLLDRKKT